LDSLKSPLIISNFQGDAVLTYAQDSSVTNGQTFLEILENVYANFAQTSEAMQRNTTCTCRACSNISKLDLKMFVHHGEYVMQDMRGKAELSGTDVIIAHRMMKNNVREQTNLQAYLLFSDAAIEKLGLREFTCEMKPHSETYEHIGEVKMFAYCLKTMWTKEREKRRDIIAPDQAWFSYEVDLSMPPMEVWRYLTEPELKTKVMAVHNVSVSDVQKGRIAQGATYHCDHGGKNTTDFKITDWKPFEYITEFVSGLPFGIRAKVTTHLSQTSNGTRLSWRFSKLSAQGASMLMLPLVRSTFKKELAKDYQKISRNLKAVQA
jgi:hypothetical protein